MRYAREALDLDPSYIPAQIAFLNLSLERTILQDFEQSIMKPLPNATQRLFATLDASHKELRHAPHVPYMDRPLPYEYGLNITPGTPLYRRVPLKSERRENEKTLAVGKGAKSSDIAKKLKDNGEELPAYLKDTASAKPSVRFDELKGDTDLVPAL